MGRVVGHVRRRRGQLIFSVVRDITGREDLELERLTTLFDNGPLGMAVMAPDGALRRVNGALADMLGRTESELLERTIFELVDDEDSRGTLAMALGSRSRAAFQFETRLRRADSHPLTVLFSATLVTNARHEPVHYVCQLLDITARAEAQERLELNEAQLAEAQQIARLGSWEWEIATDRVTWSESSTASTACGPAASRARTGRISTASTATITRASRA